ncbi:hypothetical protein ACFC09_19180 [Streptomyces sp. NPDC056161]|uniref:hypothetical protein n=1 Tax=Streptomyces sp. NPDC056161 TaxID=3345732 RepID=UPI0035D59E68
MTSVDAGLSERVEAGLRSGISTVMGRLGNPNTKFCSPNGSRGTNSRNWGGGGAAPAEGPDA